MLDRLEIKKYTRSRDYYSIERLKYWIARSYQSQGDIETAQRLFEEVIEGERLSYYAFLSSTSLSEIDKIKKKKIHEYLLENLNVPWFSTDFENEKGKLVNIKSQIRNHILNSQTPYDTYVKLSSKQQEELLSVFKGSKFELIKKRFLFLIKSGIAPTCSMGVV